MKKYESVDWEVIFIDEFDLNNENWEEICSHKINVINSNNLKLMKGGQ